MSEDRYPKPERHARLSLSLAPELVEWVKAEAKANGVPVSWVVARAVRLHQATYARLVGENSD